MSEPAERRHRGLDVCRTLTGSEEAGRGMAAFLQRLGPVGDVALYTATGQVWCREELSRRDRSLVVVAALAALGREGELRAHVAGGLNHGLERAEIDELWLQVGAYAGLPFGLAGARIAAEVFAERDGAAARTPPPAPLEPAPAAERRASGLDGIRTLLGQPDLDPAVIEQQVLESQGFTGELVIDHAFGEVWARPQLPRRDRSLAVLSILTALNLLHELEIHVRGALQHGVTRSEIEEVMVTAVVYAGFPRAIDGLRIARAVFAARDEPA